MGDYVDDAVGYAKLVVDLKTRLEQQEKEIKDLRGALQIQEKMKIPLSVIKQVTQQTQKIEKLENDLLYYKRFVPKQVIKDREGKTEVVRRGGLSSSLKKNK